MIHAKNVKKNLHLQETCREYRRHFFRTPCSLRAYLNSLRCRTTALVVKAAVFCRANYFYL